MKIDRKFNFQFNISEPKQKNNIVIFFLNTTQKLNDNYLTLTDAFSQNLIMALDQLILKIFLLE